MKYIPLFMAFLLSTYCASDKHTSEVQSDPSYQMIFQCSADNGRVVVDQYSTSYSPYGYPETRYQVVLTGDLARSAGAAGIIHNKDSNQENKLIIEDLRTLWGNTSKLYTKPPHTFGVFPMQWIIEFTNQEVRIRQEDHQPAGGDLGTIDWSHRCN